MSELPKGWVEARIGDLADINPKQAFDDETEAGFVPMSHAPTNFRDKLRFEVRPWGEIRKAYTNFKNGDVIFAKVTPCFENGKAAFVEGLPNGIGAGSSEFYVLRPCSEEVSAKYLLALVKSRGFMREGAENMTGAVGLRRVPKQFVESYPVPVPPSTEQVRIAQKLDELLTQVETLKARISTILPLLKRFHKSVLAAAVSGRLTEKWRDTAGLSESGQDVIKNDEAEKLKLLNQQPELKKKKSSIQSDIDEKYIFEIPQSWSFTTWGKISEWITYGFTRPMPKSDIGVKLLTAKDVQRFSLKFIECGLTTSEAFSSLSEKDKPIKGDLLITKDGSIGRAALVHTDETFCINQSVAVCWLRSTTMNKRYLELLSNSDFTQRFVRDKAQGMAIQHLSIVDFAKCPVPVPPYAEQTEIVRQVQQLFAFAEQLEAKVAAAKARIDKLTKSILEQAFRGELVPQDPNDEPASELLARIKAQRANTPKAKRAREASA
ncbi:type I restriction modification DNA specificity domain protein [Pseudomonas fluorescens]|uniref:Type I restriction modification DNA specificity domain protein n=1 Tax=Pseudomonas fluorescens TaxID=294 RepID=A0A0P8XJN8_PSEFL|nr:restriction endonuclease subunit S [Pseudomonas fluorescens]KPU60368.1 type I restriction modification DNA specificity domain protein [Pseudomonas fluorescens]